MIDDLRYLYWRRMSLERSMDRLATVVYRRRVLGRLYLALVWVADVSRAGMTFKNPREPVFNIIVNTDNGPKHIKVGRISRAACKQTNQLKDYTFLKRLEKNLKRYRLEYREISRRLDAVRRRLKVIPRKTMDPAGPVFCISSSHGFPGGSDRGRITPATTSSPDDQPD